MAGGPLPAGSLRAPFARAQDRDEAVQRIKPRSWAVTLLKCWTRAYAQIDSCRSPHDMHGLHSSHSNRKTSSNWPGIEIGDQIGHPRNLLPNYLDRYRLPFRPLMMCWHRYRINGRRLGTARPFPLWRLHSGPQSSSVDQYSETPPEHLPLTIAEAMRRSVVTRNFLKNNLAGR